MPYFRWVDVYQCLKSFRDELYSRLKPHVQPTLSFNRGIENVNNSRHGHPGREQHFNCNPRIFIDSRLRFAMTMWHYHQLFFASIAPRTFLNYESLLFILHVRRLVWNQHNPSKLARRPVSKSPASGTQIKLNFTRVACLVLTTASLPMPTWRTHILGEFLWSLEALPT